MKLTQLRLSNFQCFREEPTAISLEPMTFLLGPNGAGKTAVLQALHQLGFDRSMRNVRATDFHVGTGADEDDGTSTLWIEAHFEFPELKQKGTYAAIPAYFAHMQLASAVGVPEMRIRLHAELTMMAKLRKRCPTS